MSKTRCRRHAIRLLAPPNSVAERLQKGWHCRQTPDERAAAPSMLGQESVLNAWDRHASLSGGAVAFAQDRQTMVNVHGDHVMGFQRERTTHHFELHYDGDVIHVP